QRQPHHADAQQQLRQLRQCGSQREDRRVEEGADTLELGERTVGAGRQDGDATSTMGALSQPAGNRYVQQRYRSQLLRLPRELPVRLLDDLSQVVEPSEHRWGRRSSAPPASS